MKKLNVFLKGLNARNKGFTLIEILVVIGIIAVLAAIVIVAINPARQFAQARNTQRTSNVESILNAIGQNMADNKGIFNCGAGTLPSTEKILASDTPNNYDIYGCIVPTYMSSLPFDPGNPNVFDGNPTEYVTPFFTGSSDYSTGYTIDTDTNGRVTICAPGGAESAVSGSTTICLTR